MLVRNILGIAAVLVAAQFAYAHDSAPGTPDPTCEVGTDWFDHDYGPLAVGVYNFMPADGNLEDCDGDFNPTDPFCWAEWLAGEDLNGDTYVCEPLDFDGHVEFAQGGATLPVDSGDGVTFGTLLCLGMEGHHPAFGPFTVTDLALGGTVPFMVGVDTVDTSGLGDPCGDGLVDAFSDCVGACTVTFPPGLDGMYYVNVGTPTTPGTQGHVSSP